MVGKRGQPVIPVQRDEVELVAVPMPGTDQPDIKRERRRRGGEYRCARYRGGNLAGRRARADARAGPRLLPCVGEARRAQKWYAKLAVTP